MLIMILCLDIIPLFTFLCKFTNFVSQSYIGYFWLFYFSIFSKGTWPRCCRIMIHLQHFAGDFARLFFFFFFTGANCGHAVYNLIMITVGFIGAPEQNRVMDHHSKNWQF